jgi:hypothetical protein
MQRAWLKTAAAVLVVALFTGPCVRAESPFAGNWKLTDMTSGNEVTYLLFQVEEKDGKTQVKALAAPRLGDDVSLQNFKSDAKSMRFDVKIPTGTLEVIAYAPKADAKNKAVLGSMTLGNRLFLLQFTKTDDKELNRRDAMNETEEGKKFDQMRFIRDTAKQREALKEFIEKNGEKPVAYVAYEALLQNYAKEPPKDEELRAAADQFLKVGARFGPEVEHRAVATACQMLARSEKVSPVALDFIRNAEKSLAKDTPPSQSIAVLKALETALKKSGKENEAKELEPRINKLDLTLDAEFEKTAVPFKPSEYKGRKGDSKRVTVVELFTGAYCPPCVAADVAFDAALETYKPKDVILLQYHEHIPAPDRLTNTDTEARLKFYGKDVQGVPTTFVNGKPTEEGLGGPKGQGKSSYNTLCSVVDEALEKPAEAALKLNVTRNGDKIEITGDVSDLKKPGENVKLRFVLIQEVVRYPGGNGQRLHHHVVRALPGGDDGFVLKEAASKQNATVNLADLKKSLGEYLTDFNKGPRQFLDDENPLTIKHLKVVALIQDDVSREILQAVQMDVPEAK